MKVLSDWEPTVREEKGQVTMDDKTRMDERTHAFLHEKKVTATH